MIIHFTGMISYMILINTINQYIELCHIKSDNYRKHHVTYFALCHIKSDNYHVDMVVQHVGARRGTDRIVA